MEVEVYEVGPAHPEDAAAYYHDEATALRQAEAKSDKWRTVIYVWRYRVPMPTTAQALVLRMNATGQMDRPRWWNGRPMRVASFDRGTRTPE